MVWVVWPRRSSRGRPSDDGRGLEFNGSTGKFHAPRPERMTNTDPQAPPFTKRRSNFILRALVDEMLEQVRDLDRTSSTMSAEARADAELALDQLMARVRRAAMKGPAV
jgi:hypothetical protein